VPSRILFNVLRVKSRWIAGKTTDAELEKARDTLFNLQTQPKDGTPRVKKWFHMKSLVFWATHPKANVAAYFAANLVLWATPGKVTRDDLIKISEGLEEMLLVALKWKPRKSKEITN